MYKTCVKDTTQLMYIMDKSEFNASVYLKQTDEWLKTPLRFERIRAVSYSISQLLDER